MVLDIIDDFFHWFINIDFALFKNHMYLDINLNHGFYLIFDFFMHEYWKNLVQ